MKSEAFLFFFRYRRGLARLARRLSESSDRSGASQHLSRVGELYVEPRLRRDAVQCGHINRFCRASSRALSEGRRDSEFWGPGRMENWR